MLQERYGLSYKDAAHRLYLAEVKNLEMQEHGRKEIMGLKRALREIFGEAFGNIDMAEEKRSSTGPGQGEKSGRGEQLEWNELDF